LGIEAYAEITLTYDRSSMEFILLEKSNDMSISNKYLQSLYN